MESRITQKYIHKDLVKAIIEKSLVEFNNMYIDTKTSDFDYKIVSSGLKLKPENLSKFLYSAINSCINENYTSLIDNNISEKMQEEIKKSINFKVDILALTRTKDFFQYINYCFMSLTFTSYYSYIQVLKRKIFDFYGENTIHHHSYLKKSKLGVPTKIKELDGSQAVSFLEEHKNFYWLAASLGVFSTQYSNEKSLTVLYNILKEKGLSEKGWKFLIKQSEHYITRFGQFPDIGVFCANFQLKDAWLRNYNLQRLLTCIKLQKSYVYIGRLCKKWKKPVSKFNYFNTAVLKKLSSYSSDIFKKEISLMVKNRVLTQSNDVFVVCKDYFDGTNFYNLNKFTFMNKLEIYNINLTDIEEKIKILAKKHPGDKIFLTKDSPYYEMFLGILNKYNITVDINLFEYRNLTLQELARKFSKYIVEKLEKNEIQDLKNERINAINTIQENFGNNIFFYIKEMGLKRDVFIHEFINDDLFIKMYDKNTNLFEDAIKIVPFEGDDYVSKYKCFLRNMGLTKSGWKNIHSFYVNNCQTLSGILDIRDLTDKNSIKKVAHFFNKKINIYNVELYQKLVWKYYYNSLFRNSSEFNNLDLLFASIMKKMESPILVSDEEFIYNLIPENRKKIYKRIIERGQDRRGEVTEYILAKRDFNSMTDYLIGIDKKLNHKSINSILEAANQWHENNYYENLVHKNFKKENIGHVIVDGQYEFTQLTNTKDLQNESAIMHHCVAIYNEDCAKNKYVVYNMKNIHNNERATLGIRITDNGYKFDQMYAEYNNIVSSEESDAGEYIVYCLNDMKNEKNIKEQHIFEEDIIEF